MLDVCLLGTGGTVPLPRRFLTSLLLRSGGSSLLVDCGEGTQVAMRRKGRPCKPVDFICLTHYHCDHVAGLPGLLLTMGNSDRADPVTLVGPEGLGRVVGALLSVAPALPFELSFRELSGAVEELSLGGYRVRAFGLDHGVPCYGYAVCVDRAGRFDPGRAGERCIPVGAWGRLQRGEAVAQDGELFTPDMVMGPPRRGLKVVYATDTRPTERLAAEARGCDLCVLEGMHGDPGRAGRARERGHMTMQEACRVAKQAGAAELWLTHFSPAVGDPAEYAEELREIFPGTVIDEDGPSRELSFGKDR